MSADYWLVIDVGASEPVLLTATHNVTYNLGAMLRAAGFPDWDALIGAPASEAAGVLDGVVRQLRADRERLEAEFTPDNGWGNWEWAMRFTSEFRDDCQSHPKAVINGWL
jgi:hypothetical protein